MIKNKNKNKNPYATPKPTPFSTPKNIACSRAMGKIWKKNHFETNFVWAPMAQVHNVKKKSLYIMNVMFRLLSRVFATTIKNIMFMI